MRYDVVVEDTSKQPALSIRFRCSPPEIGKHLAEIYPRIFSYATQSGTPPAGPPFLRYHGMGEGQFDVEAGIPTQSMADGTDDITATTIGGGHVATTVHKGEFNEVGKAHEAIEAWLEGTKWTANGPCWDCYPDDPTNMPQEEVRTIVYWPVTA